jgi:hypothetical protein
LRYQPQKLTYGINEPILYLNSIVYYDIILSPTGNLYVGVFLKSYSKNITNDKISALLTFKKQRNRENPIGNTKSTISKRTVRCLHDETTEKRLKFYVL